MDENPFQAPEFDDADEIHPQSDADVVRKKYLNHEASVKSVGSLYLIGGVVTTFSVLAAFLIGRRPYAGVFLGVTAFYGILGILHICVGVGLRRLTKPSRIGAAVFSVFGLIVFSIAMLQDVGLFFVGTIINTYILYLLLGRKGSMVFSDYYKEVIEATPHIKYKSSLIVKVVVGLFLFFMILGVVGGIIGFFVTHR